MDHRLRLVAHKVVAKQVPLFPLPWAGADSTTVSGSQSINMDNPINVRLKDADYELLWLCSILRLGHSHRGRAADRRMAVPVSPIYPALTFV